MIGSKFDRNVRSIVLMNCQHILRNKKNIEIGDIQKGEFTFPPLKVKAGYYDGCGFLGNIEAFSIVLFVTNRNNRLSSGR